MHWRICLRRRTWKRSPSAGGPTARWRAGISGAAWTDLRNYSAGNHRQKTGVLCPMARRWIACIAGLSLCLAILYAYQRPFRTYSPMEGADSEAALPPDYGNPAELVLGRLMYPSG